MPNFKRSHHWSKYRKPCRIARTLGWGLTAQAKAHVELGEGERLPVRIQAAPPMRGGPVPDDDNLKGACKHYLDGIADAVGVNDKRFRLLEIEWLPKEGAGKIVISF